MKFNKKSPCSECPFRKNSMRGWLGPDTVSEVMAKVHAESGYPCHMDMQGKPVDNQGHVDCSGVEQCVGAILHANTSCKSYRNPDLNTMQKLLKDSSFPVLDRREFVAHHTRKKAGKK